jgi:hypothetical protein
LLAAFAPPGPLPRRLRSAAAAAAVSVAMVGGYALLATGVGRYAGLTDVAGWNLYGRVAPFADCTKFDEPERLRSLCEARPAADRPGPFSYTLLAESPAHRAFDKLDPDRGGEFGRIDPHRSGELGRFARKVIVHQPLDYGTAVGKDLVRYVEPSVLSNKKNSGERPSLLSFGYRDPAVERKVTRRLQARYSGFSGHWSSGVKWLARYQDVTRLSGVPLLAGLVLALVGLFTSRGRRRAGALFLIAVAAVLYVGPVATFSWDYRYGIPPAPFLGAAAAIGALAAVRRLRETRARSVAASGR